MSQFIIFTALFALVIIPAASTARPLAEPKFGLVARLKYSDGDSSTCWESLYQLQACTGEVILFFLNGETYLGPSCCQAIRFIQHECWPALLGSLGFTTEEGDVLEAYCGAAEGGLPPPPPSPQSPPAVETTTGAFHRRITVP